MNIRSIAGAALAAALCACGGGNSGSPMPGMLPGSAPGQTDAEALLPNTGTNVEVSIKIPRVSAAVADYVSSGTRSILIKEEKTTLGTFNTTPKSKGCHASKTRVTCTLTMAATAGANRLFTIDTYSGKLGKGKLLAEGRFKKTIPANKTTKLPLTLEGVIASIIVQLGEPHPLIGTATSMSVIVDAMDASGATIVGAGKYIPSPVRLSDSDTSGDTSLSASSVTGPASTVTLSYNGSSSLASAIISASAKGIAASKIVPGTLTPTSKAGVTVSGAAAFSVISDASGDVSAFLPFGSGIIDVPIAIAGKLGKAIPGERPKATTTLTLTPAPNECAPDLVHSQIYCMTFSSNIINIVSFDPSNVLAAPKLVGKTTTDAPYPGISFSGATCQICGIAFDPTDSAFIISTGNGYELWSIVPGATAPLKTLKAPISENFGYNALTNQIFSAWYGNDPWDTLSLFSGLDLIDVESGNRYVVHDTAYGFSASDPDAGAVDTKTNIGVSPSEISYPVYIDNLNSPPDTYVAATPFPSPFPTYAPTPGPSAAPVGTYTTTIGEYDPSYGTTLINGKYACDETYTAVDSVADYAFFGSEFCGVDYIALGQLPSTSSGTLAFSTYVDAQLPNTPAGVFESPLDPHAALVVNLPGICADCGLLFNYDKSYLAIVDLNKFKALCSGAGPCNIASSSLGGVVLYVATGIYSPPSEFARELYGAHLRTIRTHQR